MSRHVDSNLVEVDLEQLRRSLASGVPDDDLRRTIGMLIDTVLCLRHELDRQRVSVSRLRKLLFGPRSEKRPKPALATVAPEASPAAAANPSDAITAAPPVAQEPPPKPKGHGRHGAADYVGATPHLVPHATLHHGDSCPECTCGKVCTISPSSVIRLVGAAPVTAERYDREQLRCATCGHVFTATATDGADLDKYDPTVPAIVARLKYGGGFPFSRLERLQFSAGVPLPASTQWFLVSGLADLAWPVFHELVRLAAQGRLLHLDDTWARIFGPVRRRDRLHFPVPDSSTVPHSTSDAVVGQNRPRPEKRTGTFTTGILSCVDDHKIALFFTGWRHAGENLCDVLSLRDPGAAPPIQMSDALSRNMPEQLETIIANCLSHARREFVDLAHIFDGPCRHVLDELALVYHNDTVTRERAMSDSERLAWHQEHSKPVMDRLSIWMTTEVDERRVEPNSPLGKSFAYMHGHWTELTAFFRIPGAPVDNNILERALKVPILNRNSAKYFRTQRGATVADILFSLIYTTELGGGNSLHYLTELGRHRIEVAAAPGDWLPWTYEKTLSDIAAVKPRAA